MEMIKDHANPEILSCLIFLTSVAVRKHVCEIVLRALQGITRKEK
jgi:hypothetical protein